jgi:hypothetical protein
MEKASHDVPDLWAICHYEDEPQRVDFPELIEIQIYGSSKFQEVDIQQDSVDVNDQRPPVERYKISMVQDGRRTTLVYLIGIDESSMAEALVKSGLSFDHNNVVLDIVDLSIGADREAGLGIVKSIEQSPRQNPILMLTGYPVNCKRLFEEHGLNHRIISKPANHRSFVKDCMAIIEARMLATA